MAETLRYELRQRGFGWVYGPWRIQFAARTRPRPGFDWDWWHRDFDDDYGSAASRDDCIAAIHEWEDEHG